jgi:hypothetical protein
VFRSRQNIFLPFEAFARRESESNLQALRCVIELGSMLSDTHPDAEKIQIEGLRAMPSWRKFRLVNDLMLTGRKLAIAGLRERFPGAGAGELYRRLATLLLGPELANKVYGPEPNPPTLR